MKVKEIVSNFLAKRTVCWIQEEAFINRKQHVDQEPKHTLPSFKEMCVLGRCAYNAQMPLAARKRMNNSMR